MQVIVALDGNVLIRTGLVGARRPIRGAAPAGTKRTTRGISLLDRRLDRSTCGRA